MKALFFALLIVGSAVVAFASQDQEDCGGNHRPVAVITVTRTSG